MNFFKNIFKTEQSLPTYEQAKKFDHIFEDAKEPLLEDLPSYEEVMIENRKKQKAKEKLIDLMNKADNNEKVDWFYISEKCPLTEDFIRRHKDNIVWYDVRERDDSNFSTKFLQDFQKQLFPIKNKC